MTEPPGEAARDAVVIGGGGLSAACCPPARDGHRRRGPAQRAGRARARLSLARRRAARRALAAQRLLIATGLRDVLPAVPGLADRWVRDVVQCPYCHGHELRDRPLGVLATGPASVHQALLVRQWSADVNLLAHTHPLADAERRQLAAMDIRVVSGEVNELVVADDALDAVQTTAEPSPISTAALFVMPRFLPRTEALSQLGFRTDDDGYLLVHERSATSVPGVWAAGNVVDPRAQVITAAGAGAAAAFALHHDLVADRARHAVSG